MINELLTQCNDQKATDVDSSSTDVDARIYMYVQLDDYKSKHLNPVCLFFLFFIRSAIEVVKKLINLIADIEKKTLHHHTEAIVK